MSKDAVSRFVRSLNKGPVGTDSPLHPFNSPEWFARVQGSLPIAEFSRAAGRSARALVFEQCAAEQWRTKQAFSGGL